jgi:alpha-glucosidase (family GH31 glycosyl hydrolase)
MARRFLLPLLLLVACGESASPSDQSADTDAASDTQAADGSGDASDTSADGSGDGSGTAPQTCTQAPVEQLARIERAGLSVSFAGDGSWSLARGAELVTTGVATCDDAAPGARVAAGTPAFRSGFGNTIVTMTGPASRLTWLQPAGSATVEAATADAVTLRWPLAGAAGASLALRYALDEDGTLRVAMSSTLEGAATGEWSWGSAAGERFIGLGTQVTGMDLRGRVYRLWTQEQGIGKLEGDSGFPLANALEAAYAPMGVMHASGGYTMLLDEDSVSELDLDRGATERLTLRTAGSLPALSLHPWARPSEGIAWATGLTGRPPQVPDWAFAPWNHAVGGPAELTRVATLLREADVPSSAIWSEDWIGGSQSGSGFRLSYAWEWDPARYPDLPTDIDRLHTQGFAFLGYLNPFVPGPTRMFGEGEAGGFLVKNEAGATYTTTDPAFRQTGLVDLTNPAAASWYESYVIKAVNEVGLDGWMADFAEWLPLEGQLESGESLWLEHNRYPLAYQRSNTRGITAANGGVADPDRLYFSRSGWASRKGGTSGIAPVLWSGDQNTDWGTDDGLPSVVPISLHVSASGVSMFATDIAGYTSVTVPNTTKELFYRWTVVGAFEPVMRTHHGSDKCGNWGFDWDEESLAHFRRYAKIHSLLYPVWRGLLDEAQATGMPILRHPFLADPTGNWDRAGYAWFIGENLFVTPVLAEGATMKTTALPPGVWWPLFGDAPLASAADWAAQEVAIPLTEAGAFVRAGTALPLLTRAPATMRNDAAATVSSLAALGDNVRFALYPAASGAASGAGRGASVSATGLRPGWVAAGATWNGTVLPACADSEAQDCVDESAKLYRVVGAGSLVSAGGAATVEAAAGQTVELAFGRDGWGSLAEPTVVTDLNPNVDPPCLP